MRQNLASLAGDAAFVAKVGVLGTAVEVISPDDATVLELAGEVQWKAADEEVRGISEGEFPMALVRTPARSCPYL